MIRRTFFLFLFFLIPIRGIWTDAVSLTIVFSGDFHSYLSADKQGNGGAARIANYHHQVRQTEKNVLILNAGDWVTGTPVSMMFKGDPVFHVANHWSLDASALGNHEFDQGWQRIEQFRKLAEFPLLCGNAFVRREDGQLHLLADDAYRIFTFGSLRIAVLSVLTEATPFITRKQDVEGVVFTPAKEALQRMVGEVRERCDLILALKHVGVENDAVLAQDVSGLDLILGGHSHTVLSKPRYVNGVPIVHSGSKGRSIGRIDLVADTDTDQITQLEYRLIPVTPDLGQEKPDTLHEVEHWESQAAEWVDRPLGIADEAFDKNAMIRLAEAAFLEAAGADYAHHNTGGTRGALPEGSFTYRDIFTIYPFENTLVIGQVEGRGIPDNFWGLESIQPERTYRIVTHSFIRDQIDRYLPSLKHVVWQDTGIDMRDAILRYIEKRKNIHRVQLTR